MFYHKPTAHLCDNMQFLTQARKLHETCDNMRKNITGLIHAIFISCVKNPIASHRSRCNQYAIRCNFYSPEAMAPKIEFRTMIGSEKV